MMFRMMRMLVVVGMVAVLAGGCGIWWDDEGSGPHPSYSSVSGKLAQGYVKNANVIADKTRGAITGNFQCDTGEVCTTSDDNGDFSLSIDINSYGSYVLYSYGGTVADSNGVQQPALPMLAPAGARNVTPATTLVALNPSLEDAIGDDWDADIASSGGASATVVKIAKSVETVLKSLSSSTAPVITSASAMLAVTQKIATQLGTQGSVSDTAIQAAVSAGVTEALQDTTIVEAGVVTDASAVLNAVNTAVSTGITTINTSTSSSGTVIETNVTAAIETAVTTATTTVATSTKTVKMSVSQVAAKNASNTTLVTLTPPATTSVPSPVPQATANNITSMDFTLSVTNELGTNQTYTAYVTAVVSDSQSARRANATVGPVTVTVSAGNVVDLQTSTSTVLTITGKNADGSDVAATITNTSPTGDPISISNNLVTVDLETIGNKISSAVGTTSDLFDVGLPGVYTVTLSASGVPLASYSGTITVQ